VKIIISQNAFKIMKKILIFSVILMTLKAEAQLPSFQENGYKMLDSVKGASLYTKAIRSKLGNYNVHLHVIDLRYVKMGQWISPTKVYPNTPIGHYLAVEKHNKSPYFKLETPNNALKDLKNAHKKKLFGIINAAFYEQLYDSTQLAFPLKVQGDIVTAGSSPYGPQKNPKHPYYKKVVFETLVWTDSSVTMQKYNTQTGFPLTSDNVKNALVTYNYKDHPANIIRAPSANLYYVVGTLSEDNKPSPYVFILTVNATTLENAAAELTQLGIKSSIMTIDGGASVLIYNARKGTLMSPRSPTLPHYLFFVEK
jgi:hypothetical protein